MKKNDTTNDLERQYGHLSDDDVLAEIDRLRKEAAADRRQADAPQAFLDSPVRQLLKANPTMSTGEAMIQLGYWKKPEEE